MPSPTIDAPTGRRNPLDDRTISRLVTGRATKHLRYATLALAGTLLLAAAVVTHLQQQYGTVRDNFTANQNVHYVAVTFRTGQGTSETGNLRFSDVERIAQIADEAAAGGTQTVARYHLPFGLTASDGTSYFVDSLSDGGAGLLGRTSLPDGVAVGGGTTAHRVEVDVPVVHSEAGGMSTDDSKQVALNTEPLADDPPLAVFGSVDRSQLFVSEATFGQLISIVGDGVDWATFRGLHDSGSNPFGFEAVASVYVHMDDLADVDAAGHALEKAGYSTSYTLRAFDDLAGSLSGGVNAGLVLMAVALLLCLVLTFTNLQSYLTLAHRDMGILKHIGYPGRRVEAVYRIRLAAMVTRAALPAALLVLAAGVTRFSDRPWIGAIDLIVVVVFAAVLFGVVSYVQLPRHVRRPVLTLLKMDRQFD